MGLRVGNDCVVDHDRNLSGRGVEPTDGRLSDLDESRAYGESWTCIQALNASLTLSRGEGTNEKFTDLSSSYGAVNFGHCNEEIRLPAHPSSDLVAGVYPPEAERFLAG